MHIANTFDEGNGRAYSCVLQQLTALTLLRRLAIGHNSLTFFFFFLYPTPDVTALLAASSDLRLFSTANKSADAVDLQPLLAAMPHALSIQVQSRTLALSGSALQLPSALTALDLSVSGAPRSGQLDALSRALCRAGTRLQAVSLAGFQPVASIAGILWGRLAQLTSLRDLCLSLPFARAQEWVAAMAESLPALCGLRKLHVFDLSMCAYPESTLQPLADPNLLDAVLRLTALTLLHLWAQPHAEPCFWVRRTESLPRLVTVRGGEWAESVQNAGQRCGVQCLQVAG